MWSITFSVCMKKKAKNAASAWREKKKGKVCIFPVGGKKREDTILVSTSGEGAHPILIRVVERKIREINISVAAAQKRKKAFSSFTPREGEEKKRGMFQLTEEG